MCGVSFFPDHGTVYCHEVLLLCILMRSEILIAERLTQLAHNVDVKTSTIDTLIGECCSSHYCNKQLNGYTVADLEGFLRFL